MAGISFGGLASGLDTNSIVQQLLAVESRPITLLTDQKTTLQNRASAFKDLNTRLSALENAAFELTKISNIITPKASTSDSDKLGATANANAVTGSYQVEVLRLATTTKLRTGTGAGQGNTLGGIADATDFSGESLSQLNSNHRLSDELQQGTFFVNGQQVLVTGSDTLSSILANISTATGGSVSGSLVSDPAKGGLVVQLTSASPISVANGTSNVLSLLKLDTASYSGGALTSSDAVNSAHAELKLDGSGGATNLAGTVSSGTLSINGVQIDYNVATDSLNDVIKRINDSQAGVRATFVNTNGGQVSLINKSSGALAIAISDTGSLAAALGLQASDAQSLGQSAQLRIDGGAIQSFNKNAGITAAGLDGVLLDLRDPNPGNPYTVTVDGSAATATDKLKAFVDQFNNVTSTIDQLTAYNADTKAKGILQSDASITGLRSHLLDLVFGRIGGLHGSNAQGSLAELGISTGAIGSNPGTTIQLQLDSGKLASALEKDPTRVAQLLGATNTTTGEAGVMTRLKSYVDGLSNSTGVFKQRSDVIKSQIDGLDNRIDTLTKRLTTKQKLLEAQFTNLETILSKLQAQQSSLANLFNKSSN